MSQDKHNPKNAHPSAPAADSDWLSRQDDLMGAKQTHTSSDAAKADSTDNHKESDQTEESVDRPDYVEAGLAEAEGSAVAPKGETDISTKPPVDKNWLAKQDAVLERSGGSDTSLDSSSGDDAS